MRKTEFRSQEPEVKNQMIPVISLWQPWAMWVCLKWKTIETRYHQRFKKLNGQRIAIHAAQKIDKTAFINEYLPDNLTALQIENMVRFVMMRRGQIICTAKIVAARWAPNIGFDEREEWNKKAMCEVAGKFCLFLEEIQPLRDRIPYRGRQGIFYVPEKVIGDAL